ncbi:transcriptional regulator, AsnC family [Denitrovibrio acetiphilus DSM 12809]|uniref:Transcriptional regulator, AsnC family n=1 Tax=Denitrovibrio acetiphilus (strain DSM 12809 / NBRC 114555 / N2460) TaxID=522772 RepID=D4H3R4_DENA2|nr:Lrp/AsnC family transcriptional regulator [Denitrovibrio acetiphilus]ADD69166.1 transcriptional regulator, AsnC family [Denitrovibrio acetiphilus DSM 12809]
MRHQIDEKDKQILNLLMDNARISYADIAKAVGMKSPSVIDRIKRLEQIGVIKGYSAEIDYKILGDDINAFIGVSMDNAKHIEEFESQLKEIDPDVIDCNHVTGDYTFLISVVTKNTQSLSKLIKKIRNIPGVDKTNTILVFSTLMNRKRQV